MEGISYETFRTWQMEKSVFSVALKKAEAECKVARIHTVLKASEKSWQAAAWWARWNCPASLRYAAAASKSRRSSERTKPDGERQPSRYLLFHIPVVLEKKVHLVHNGKFVKGYEKVVVREVGLNSDERQYSNVEVLAR